MREPHRSTKTDSYVKRPSTFDTNNPEWEYSNDYSKDPCECVECQKVCLEEETSTARCYDCAEYLCADCHCDQFQSVLLAIVWLVFFRKQKENDTKETNDHVNETKTMCESCKQVSSELDRLKNSVKHLSEENLSSQETYRRQSIHIGELNTKAVVFESQLLAVQRQIEDLYNISHDGSMMLRISAFSERFRDVQLQGRIMIATQVFYSSPTGYKMRVDLYLNSDGHSTHLSMNFVVLRGEHDNILSWPFTSPISVCLFDQTDQGHHVINSFNPDPTSTSFQKPRTDANPASHVTKLFPLNILYQRDDSYSKDDTMFIKVMLVFPENPTVLLPYEVDLHPALPAHVHENLQRKRFEEYARARRALDEEIIQTDQNLCQSSMIPPSPRAPQAVYRQLLSSTTSQSGVSCEDTLS